MNWDQVEGKWDQMVGSMRTKWGKLTDDDWQAIKGRKEELVGRLQERYGKKREEAEREADAYVQSL